MMEENNESSRRNFVRQLEKYTLAEKHKLGECVEMFKKEYDAQVECWKGKSHCDAKRKSLYHRMLEFMLHFHNYIIVLLILFKLIFNYWLLITLKY